LAQKEPSVRRDKLDLILEGIQQKLFDMGSELATLPGDEYEGQITLQPEDAEWLEEVIDAMNEDLKPLQSFILPGGTPLNSFLHQARTVCRRAERDVIRLSREEVMNPEIVKFLNRLSDFLFVAGRWVTATLGEQETLWQPGKTQPEWKW
jgi:cob(I)alamin adenosyltransferase